ncbi:hypothetical protein C3495_11950 [Clostridiaceae bacterium 14S0207]|nr:hypothetical protein C3495_11950 [Clostridiaceae bacterium 14S0207]
MQNINSIKDAYVYQGNPYSTFENSPVLYVGNNNAIGTSYKSFLYFDVSQIPANNFIQSADLKLYVLQKTIAGSVTVNIYRLGGSFDPAFLTWSSSQNIPTIATTDTLLVTNNDEYVTADITDIVQGWVNGTQQNNGIMISIDNQVNGYIQFASNNNPLISCYPVLEINSGSSQLEQDQITSGNFNIITSTSTVEGSKIATTHAITNNGTQPYNKALAVIQLNYNNQWYDEKGKAIYPGTKGVISTWAARNQEQLAIISAKSPTLYSFIPSATGGSYNLGQNLQVNTSNSALTESFNNQVGLLFSENPVGAPALNISPTTGTVTIPAGFDLTNAVTRTIEVVPEDINDCCNNQSLTFSNVISNSANNAQINAALTAAGVGDVANIITASNVSTAPNAIEVANGYANFLSGISNTIYEDMLINSDKNLEGLNVSVYYYSENTGNYQQVASNVPLSGNSIYLSQIIGQQPVTLLSKNNINDRYKILVNPTSTATGSYQLSINTIAGTLSGNTINPANVKYLTRNPIVTLNVQ